ncbi:MAG TPA: redoxin domain-containing protein [Niastella sp.]|nr:redoxin domain-containing protein [Niastella sp.]
MKNLIIAICVLTVLSGTVRAQSVNVITTGNPQVGQLCPEFSFDTLFNYKKDKLALSELKGKFVIIDFWGTFCMPCITDFPRWENLQKRFGDTLQFLLVPTDGYVKTKQFYDAREKANKPMTLPCGINSNLVKYFQVKEVSTFAWIDNQGYIKAITDYAQLTEKNIADFVNRKELVAQEKETFIKVDYKKSLFEIAKETDSNSVLYGSVFTKYVKGLRSVLNPGKRVEGRIYLHNMPIRNLYQLAFGDADTTGTFEYSRTIVESAHPEKIAPPEGEDFNRWKIDNTYCYELRVPAAKKKDIYKIMRKDLQQLLGYNAYLEYRMQKCLVLKADKGFRYLEDTTIAPKLSVSAGGLTVRNYPFSRFTSNIRHYLAKQIFIDETGLSGRVDITIQAPMNEIDAVNTELKKYGLSIQSEDRQVQMLIIKDPQ